MTELAYTRYLFDVYRARGTRCIVVDGEDVIWRTLEISNAVCDALGIEQDCISDRWEAFPPEELPTNPLIAHFTKPFYESSGIVRPAEKVSSSNSYNQRPGLTNDCEAIWPRRHREATAEGRGAMGQGGCGESEAAC